MLRSEHKRVIHFNGKLFKQVLIDPHYREKHGELNEELILELVSLLNGQDVEANTVTGVFSYFVFEPLHYHLKPYQLS